MLKLKLAGWMAVAAMFMSPIAGQAAESGFSALQGVEAQSLGVEEMNAVAGELSAADIAAALGKLAANVKNQTLSADLSKLATAVTNNAAAIDKLLGKLPKH